VNRRLSILVVALWLAGCAAVGPNYKLPPQAVVNAPAASGAFVSAKAVTAPDAPPDHWWKLFNDPVLDRLVESAIAANTDLRVADANLERAHALLDEARGGL